MVFSSFNFFFLFLPVTLVGFFILGRRDEHWAASWLLLASLAFYVSWNLAYLPILAISIVGNYLAYRGILQAAEARKKAWLILAVTGNLLLLGYFKYANFFIQSVNDLTGAGIHPLDVLLPIGISFFTFTQIAFLVDARHDRAADVGLWRYALFASYFPYIVAGPVLNHKDMLPQFADRQNYAFSAENLAVGLSLFTFGLAKKVLIADNLVPVVGLGLGGDDPQLLAAWIGILAYSLQIYFDFSGYSDMAIGVSRMLGFQIPFNFDSPYKADQCQRVLDPLAHLPVALSAQLSLYPPGWQPPRPVQALPQPHADHAAGWTLAWLQLDLRHLGRPARPLPLRAAWLADLAWRGAAGTDPGGQALQPGPDLPGHTGDLGLFPRP